MTPSTFGYSICFAVFFAAIGLIVGPHSKTVRSPASIEEKSDFEAAILMRRGRAYYYHDRYAEALVCFRGIRDKYPTSSDAKAAAYAEIVILNKIKNLSELMKFCDEYLEKYPDAENAEQVATLAGELLVQTGNWAEIGKFYKGLEAKFPASPSMDRYIFFQGVSFFYGGKLQRIHSCIY